MNMEQVIVKSEGESSGELLVFYVDENGSHEEGVITAIQNIDQSDLEQLQRENYIIEAVDETCTEMEVAPADQHITSRDRWLDEETKRLLIFYIDNKETFLNGITKKKHLWTVACKTMLTDKTATSCEMKLRNLKRSYSAIRVDQAKGIGLSVWPYYDLCHQAFHDDNYVNMLISDSMEGQGASTVVPAAKQDNGILVVKKVNNTRSVDEQVGQMLDLYLAHKKSNKENWQKHVWEIIAIEIGEDGDYWHKRFLNFKHHYITMLEKRKESGPESIVWPYMKIFDQIYENDKDFQRKYGNPRPKEAATVLNSTIIQSMKPMDWDETEKTVLVKYCFDSFDEFQDPTIPNSFLWNEVGRLLDKTPEICKKKFEELKIHHIDQYVAGKYDMRNRKPISILFDNIISKETEILLSKPSRKAAKPATWDTEETDKLIQFLYVNMEMFKDPICHFVCLAAVSRQLKHSVHTCYSQWRDQTELYKSVLDEKKEDPELEINWKYIELFDIIFDYGMDTKLLEGYEKPVEVPVKIEPGKVGVKKLNINLEEDFSENEDFEEYDERGFVKRSRGTGDSKQFKILEYYQKNKDRFTTQRKKQAQWEVLAKQIGISTEQCAHRFRNLKQVYMAYIQREINKPEMPILWPYYNLCKKVFGYRAIKNKLRNGKIESDDSEEWTPKQIKQVINHFAKNFSEIDRNSDDKDLWASLAREIGRSEASCRDKFLELRKSYRKIKTMMNRNPNCKVNWKYFKLFDQIYTGTKVEDMEVDSSEEKYVPSHGKAVKTEEDDDDYQCIIVLPEGDELTDISNAQIILKGPEEPAAPKPPETNKFLWGVRSKKLLLKTYLEYIKSQKGKIINTNDMWLEIAKKLPTKAFSCKKMYLRLKAEFKRKQNDEQYITKSPYYKLLNKIMASKPKLFQPKYTIDDVNLSERKTYRDILLPLWKVEQALQYYLDHMEEFICPNYEAKYAWQALSNHASVPVYKIFHKVNFLKHNYNIETGEVAGKKVDFDGLLNRIFEKEFTIRIAMAATEIKPMMVEEEVEDSWEDDDTEQLLNWYLDNLDKFKNPQNVPSSLWMEASSVLMKTPLACSKKMSEIRTQYSSMVKETPEALVDWRFHELCQKIYGTGKKS